MKKMISFLTVALVAGMLSMGLADGDKGVAKKEACPAKAKTACCAQATKCDEKAKAKCHAEKAKQKGDN